MSLVKRGRIVPQLHRNKYLSQTSSNMSPKRECSPKEVKDTLPTQSTRALKILRSRKIIGTITGLDVHGEPSETLELSSLPDRRKDVPTEGLCFWLHHWQAMHQARGLTCLPSDSRAQWYGYSRRIRADGTSLRAAFDPFKTALPFWGHSDSNSKYFVPKTGVRS